MWQRAVKRTELTLHHLIAPSPKFLLTFAICHLLSACRPAPVGSKPVVVTTLPDLADWIREVGGERVEVFVLLRGTEEPHSYEPKPTDLERIVQAKVLVRVGMGLDDWLEGLIANAQNPRLKVVTVADVVHPLPDDEGVHGVHQKGNPHIWLDPANAKNALPLLVQALSAVDPLGKEFYQNRAERYAQQIDSITEVLKQMAANCRDRKFVAMHNSWSYFCRAFGFELTAVIEPLPGQEPSARHLAEIVKRMKRESVRRIVIEPHHNRDIAEAVAREVDGAVIVMSSVTGALPYADTYLKLLDFNVRALVNQ